MGASFSTSKPVIGEERNLRSTLMVEKLKAAQDSVTMPPRPVIAEKVANPEGVSRLEVTLDGKSMNMLLRAIAQLQKS